jgi:crotonobetainyl-CoA:carnitine CoA-transferase CaiB-like acyl-CoA transferase
MVVDLEHPSLGALKTLGTPIKVADGPPFRPAPPPGLGAHTDSVLRELLAYPSERIDVLRRQGVIG